MLCHHIPEETPPTTLLQKPQKPHRMLLSLKVTITTFVVYSIIVITISHKSATIAGTENDGKGGNVNITA
jgi:hypothetical protein